MKIRCTRVKRSSFILLVKIKSQGLFSGSVVQPGGLCASIMGFEVLIPLLLALNIASLMITLFNLEFSITVHWWLGVPANLITK